MIVRCIFLFFLSFTTSALSQVLEVNGEDIDVTVTDEEATSGDRYYLVNQDGKKKGYIKLEKQIEDKWQAKLIKGKAQVGWDLLAKESEEAPSASTPPPVDEKRGGRPSKKNKNSPLLAQPLMQPLLNKYSYPFSMAYRKGSYEVAGSTFTLSLFNISFGYESTLFYNFSLGIKAAIELGSLDLELLGQKISLSVQGLTDIEFPLRYSWFINENISLHPGLSYYLSPGAKTETGTNATNLTETPNSGGNSIEPILGLQLKFSSLLFGLRFANRVYSATTFEVDVAGQKDSYVEKGNKSRTISLFTENHFASSFLGFDFSRAQNESPDNSTGELEEVNINYISFYYGWGNANMRFSDNESTKVLKITNQNNSFYTDSEKSQLDSMSDWTFSFYYRSFY